MRSSLLRRFGGSIGNAYTQAIRLRPNLASVWRFAFKYMLIIAGYALFGWAQLLIANGIIGEQVFLVAAVLGALLVMAVVVRWPYAACIVWLMGSPYAKYFLEFKIGQGIPLLTFDGVIIPSLAIVLLLRAFMNRRKLAKPEAGESFLLLFVFYVLASKYARREITPTVARNFVLYSFGLWPMMYYVFKAAVKTREQMVRLMVALVVAAVFASCTFIYEATTGKSFYSVILGSDIGLRWTGVKEGRSVGVFGSPIEPGHLLITGALLAMHFFGHAKKALGKPFYVLAVVAVVVGLWHTYTRGNYLCFFVAASTLMLLSRGRAKFYWVLVPLMVVGALGWGMIAMSDSDVRNRLTSDTLSNRAIFARTAMNVIRHNLWFGVGWQNAGEATRRYIVSRKQYEGLTDDRGQPIPTRVHSTYLQITQENGIIGALLYYGAVLLFLKAAIQLWSRAPANDILGKDFVAILIASVIAWLASSITYESSTSSYANGVLMVIFALVSRLHLLLTSTEERLGAKSGYEVNAIKVGLH